MIKADWVSQSSLLSGNTTDWRYNSARRHRHSVRSIETVALTMVMGIMLSVYLIQHLPSSGLMLAYDGIALMMAVPFTRYYLKS